MNESVTISLKGKTYEVKYPTVGQYYNIESLKQTLSLGIYNTMAKSCVTTAVNACDMIDVEATLCVLCPEFIKDLKVESFKDLGLKDYVEIKKVWSREILPFLKEVEKILSDVE